MEVRHWRSWFAQSSSNGHNFSVLNPNRAPFEAMDSWLPNIWNDICYAWNGLQEVLQNVSNRGAAATFPFMACALKDFKAWRFRSHFAAAKWGYEAAKWHSCAKEWFHSCETPCGMGLWLRFFFSFFGFRSHFAAAKWGSLCCEVALVCQNWFRSYENFRREGHKAANWFRSKVTISQRLQNLTDPYFYLVFALFLLRFCSKRLPFNFFAFSPTWDHPKTYITSKQIRIKALKSKLKHLNQNLKHWNQN